MLSNFLRVSNGLATVTSVTDDRDHDAEPGLHPSKQTRESRGDNLVCWSLNPLTPCRATKAPIRWIFAGI